MHYFVPYFNSQTVFISHIKRPCISLHETSPRTTQFLSQNLMFWRATKRSHVVAVTATIEKKLQTLFTKSCIRTAPIAGIIYHIFQEMKNPLISISYPKPYGIKSRKRAILYVQFESVLSLYLAQAEGKLWGIFQCQLLGRDSLWQTRDIEKYLRNISYFVFYGIMH